MIVWTRSCRVSSRRQPSGFQFCVNRAATYWDARFPSVKGAIPGPTAAAPPAAGGASPPATGATPAGFISSFLSVPASPAPAESSGAGRRCGSAGALTRAGMSERICFAGHDYRGSVGVVGYVGGFCFYLFQHRPAIKDRTVRATTGADASCRGVVDRRATSGFDVMARSEHWRCGGGGDA